jgi:hypothetical protein
MNIASVIRNSGSFHLGFDHELVASFPDKALSQTGAQERLLKSVLHRPGIGGLTRSMGK